MKNKRILALTLLVSLLSSLAQAHTHLQKAMPADNSILASPPSQLMLHFSEATRLTAVSIQKEGTDESTNVSTLPKEAAQALTVPMSPMSPGKYLVKWRAIGADNHVMSGTLHFTVTGK
jgi:methionine-rich copper-binding protein CopC